MNILILNSILFTSEKGNIPTVCSIKDTMIYNMALGFFEEGHQVTLIAAEEYKPQTDESYPFEIIFMKSFCPKIFKPDIFPFQLGLILYLTKKKKNIDLILTSEVFSMQTLISALLARKKTVIWHELALHNRFLFKLPSKCWYNLVAKFSLQRCLVIPRSKNSQQFIRSYMRNVSDEPVEHGININRFKINSCQEKQFVVCSQLIPRKRIDKIIEIFSEFISQDPYKEYKLIIIGRGDEKNKLESLCKKKQVENSVIFHGFMTHEQLSEIIAKSKALLINTEKDNNMVSIPEAICAGTPIITTPIPTNSSYIKENQLGIVKENWDKEDLIAMVEKNSEYKNNCINYRNNLSNAYITNKIIKQYLKYNSTDEYSLNQ